MSFSNDIHLIPPQSWTNGIWKWCFFFQKNLPFVEGLFSGSMWNFRGCTSMLEPNQCGLVVDDGVILYHLGMFQNHRSLAQSPTFYQEPVGATSQVTKSHSNTTRIYIYIHTVMYRNRTHASICKENTGRYQNHICKRIFPNTDQVWWNTSCKSKKSQITWES